MIIRVPQADGEITLTIAGQKHVLEVHDYLVDAPVELVDGVLGIEGAYREDGPHPDAIWEHPAGDVTVTFTPDDEDPAEPADVEEPEPEPTPAAKPKRKPRKAAAPRKATS